jgi:hypothetical protein
MRHVIEYGPEEYIEIDYEPGRGGNISSAGLKFDEPGAVSEGTAEALAAYNGAIDGLEHLILAQACAGIDVTSDAYRHAVFTALDAINNQYG